MLRPVQRVREQDRHRVVRVANDFDAFDGEVLARNRRSVASVYLMTCSGSSIGPRQSFGTKTIAYPSGFSTRAISCAKTSRRIARAPGMPRRRRTWNQAKAASVTSPDAWSSLRHAGDSPRIARSPAPEMLVPIGLQVFQDSTVPAGVEGRMLRRRQALDQRVLYRPVAQIPRFGNRAFQYPSLRRGVLRFAIR